MDVFISYSTKDQELMEEIMRHLEAAGISCWFAPRNIMPGAEWVTAINDAIEEAKIFLLIYTENSNSSRQVHNEVALTFNMEKIMIPLRLADIPMNTEMKYYLTRVHWLDAVNQTPEHKFWEEGSIKEARDCFEKAALQGDARGQLALETMHADELLLRMRSHEKDLDVNAESAEIKKCGEELVRGGFTEANYLLGFYYAEEFSGVRDKKKAFSYFELAGNAYRNLGEGENAFAWYQKAAEAGNMAAMNQLGLAYLRGDGVEENKELSREWFQKAADAGEESAKGNLEYLLNMEQ